MALESGGAFRIGQSNITVHDSNIYDNFAPQGSTMSASYITDDPGRVSADMRYNWWGADSNGNARGADNSVFAVQSPDFCTDYGLCVAWQCAGFSNRCD